MKFILDLLSFLAFFIFPFSFGYVAGSDSPKKIRNSIIVFVPYILVLFVIIKILPDGFRLYYLYQKVW